VFDQSKIQYKLQLHKRRKRNI